MLPQICMCSGILNTGISSDIMKRIFDQGFSTKPRPRPGNPMASGSGYGLYVIRRTLEEVHKGRIWVESEPGRGTAFIFWIPMR